MLRLQSHQPIAWQPPVANQSGCTPLLVAAGGDCFGCLQVAAKPATWYFVKWPLFVVCVALFLFSLFLEE